MKIGCKEITNPLEVLECIVAFDSKDYSANKRDRMLYAIILGWDDNSYKEFGLNKEDVNEYKLLRKRYEQLKEKATPKKPKGIEEIISLMCGTHKYGRCPSCDTHVTINQKFCKNCGQALDWESE